MTAVVHTRDTTAAHATRILHALGDTPDTVATRLAEAGIRGERCNEGTCPVATWLMRSDLGLREVAVPGDHAILYFGDGDDWCYVDVPDAVEEFIERFDQGAYDNLLKTVCIRCKATPAATLCCSSHKAQLCHGCYRRTHFVEICVEGCRDCAREGLDLVLAGGAR